MHGGLSRFPPCLVMHMHRIHQQHTISFWNDIPVKASRQIFIHMYIPAEDENEKLNQSGPIMQMYSSVRPQAVEARIHVMYVMASTHMRACHKKKRHSTKHCSRAVCQHMPLQHHCSCAHEICMHMMDHDECFLHADVGLCTVCA